jgi:hypothetical protein
MFTLKAKLKNTIFNYSCKKLQYMLSSQNTLPYNTRVLITAVKNFTVQAQPSKHTILQHHNVNYNCKKLYSKCLARKNILSYNARVLIEEHILDTTAGKQLS